MLSVYPRSAAERVGAAVARAFISQGTSVAIADLDIVTARALAKALSNLSIFAAANADTLESVDINPFVVHPKGKGAVALDALVVPVTS